MIPKDLEARIFRLRLVEHWPVGTIARELGVHHSTVKRVLHHQGLPVDVTSRPSMVEPFSWHSNSAGSARSAGQVA